MPEQATQPTAPRTGHPARLSGFALRLLGGYLACLVVVTATPTLFPRAVLPVFRLIQRPLSGRVLLDGEIEASRDKVLFSWRTSALTTFTDLADRPLPLYAFKGSVQTGTLNVYPVVGVALLFAWPLSRRVRLLAGLLLLPLLILAAAVDLCVMLQWTHAKSVAAIWVEVLPHVAASTANEDAFKALQVGFDRLTRWKSFISTGGRPFTAAMLTMAAIGLAAMRNRRVTPSSVPQSTPRVPPGESSPRKTGS